MRFFAALSADNTDAGPERAHRTHGTHRKGGDKVDIETTNLSNLHTFFFNTNYHVIDHELFMNFFKVIPKKDEKTKRTKNRLADHG